MKAGPRSIINASQLVLRALVGSGDARKDENGVGQAHPRLTGKPAEARAEFGFGHGR